MNKKVLSFGFLYNKATKKRVFFKKNNFDPFLRMDLIWKKATTSLLEDRVLVIPKSPGVPEICFINLGRMEDWFDQ